MRSVGQGSQKQPVIIIIILTTFFGLPHGLDEQQAEHRQPDARHQTHKDRLTYATHADQRQLYNSMRHM